MTLRREAVPQQLSLCRHQGPRGADKHPPGRGVKNRPGNTCAVSGGRRADGWELNLNAVDEWTQHSPFVGANKPGLREHPCRFASEGVPTHPSEAGVAVTPSCAPRADRPTSGSQDEKSRTATYCLAVSPLAGRATHHTCSHHALRSCKGLLKERSSCPSHLP